MNFEDHPQNTPTTIDKTDAHVTRYAGVYCLVFVIVAFGVIYLVLSHRLHL
jgi:hypothetical protein